ncbi:unnamed protein product [Phytomonas sp. Hart1]|nr:unnamed protein product [Phytomonas sp. Hart1]|eukprot:CCW69259.1 unnamed protein product [Phytomonas sp. isolate Hart1]
MADLLSLKEITNLREVFSAYDTDGDGNITPEDLDQIFASMGQSASSRKNTQKSVDADADSNGMIDFPEFLTIIAVHLNDPEEKECRLKRVFKLYDLGNTGYISATNLRLVMERLGCPLTPEEAFEMINEADTDGDGKLNFEDFKRVAADEWNF